MPYIEKLYIELEQLYKLLDQLDRNYRYEETRTHDGPLFLARSDTLSDVRRNLFAEAEKVMLNQDSGWSTPVIERIKKWRR